MCKVVYSLLLIGVGVFVIAGCWLLIGMLMLVDWLLHGVGQTFGWLEVWLGIDDADDDFWGSL